MKKHKRQFEDYEEIALDLRTARELLLWTTHIFKRAPYTDTILKMCEKLDRLISKTEDEMFNDWPEMASTDVFYGGEDYRLYIRKHQDYIYSSFGCDSCKLVDSFAILTRDGAVLLSDDARVTFEEDAKLREINKNMIRRSKEDGKIL